ncbi:FUSC family protein [Kitasatospora sp. NBC_01560]|uniref:FUSC family protein n=1 Tax=Kitasatospora sp. NBC_01560 TaxID=2975965 RepID=UPI00386F7543
MARELRRPSRTELATAARILVCATVPWYLCILWGTSDDPVPAALPAVLILPSGLDAAPRLAVQRMAGVLAGVGLSVAVLRIVPQTPYALPLVLALGWAGSLLIRHDGAPNNQVVVSALMVFAVPVAGYPGARLVETAVGVLTVCLLGPRHWRPTRVRRAWGRRRSR